MLLVQNRIDLDTSELIPGISLQVDKDGAEYFSLLVEGPDEVDGEMVEPLQGNINIHSVIHPVMFGGIKKRFNATDPTKSAIIGKKLKGDIVRLASSKPFHRADDPVTVCNAVTITVLYSSDEERSAAIAAAFKKRMEYYEQEGLFIDEPVVESANPVTVTL